MEGWYKYAQDRDLPPKRVTIKSITTEQVDLYWQVPYPGENTPVVVKPFAIDDTAQK